MHTYQRILLRTDNLHTFSICGINHTRIGVGEVEHGMEGSEHERQLRCIGNKVSGSSP